MCIGIIPNDYNLLIRIYFRKLACLCSQAYEHGIQRTTEPCRVKRSITTQCMPCISQLSGDTPVVNMVRMEVLASLVMVTAITGVHGQGFFSGLQSMAHKLNPFKPKQQQSFKPFVQTLQGQFSQQQQQFPIFQQHLSQNIPSQQISQQQSQNFLSQQISQQPHKPVTSFVHNANPIPSPSFFPNSFFHPRPLSLLQSQTKEPSLSSTSTTLSQQSQGSGNNRSLLNISDYVSS